jgi:hypothetical protein
MRDSGVFGSREAHACEGAFRGVLGHEWGTGSTSEESSSLFALHMPYDYTYRVRRTNGDDTSFSCPEPLVAGDVLPGSIVQVIDRIEGALPPPPGSRAPA